MEQYFEDWKPAYQHFPKCGCRSVFLETLKGVKQWKILIGIKHL